MARKNVAFKLVRQNEDNEENIKDYIKPVSLYHKLGERSKNSPYFLRRSLNYIIQAKKEKQTNSDGTIIFDYMDRRNKTLKVEVVNKFSCPFCSVPCGVFEGMQFHLTSSHYVFEYKFRQADEAHGHEVDVSLKQERVKFGGGEQWTPFMFRSKRRRLRQGNDSNVMKPLNVRFLRLDINQLPSDTEIEVTNVNDERISTQPLTDQSTDILSPTQPEIQPPTGQTSDIVSPTQPEIGQSSEPQEVLPVNRRKKLRAKRATAKRLDRLKSRQFYHSRTMQPMTYEEVIADEDSEDEGDDDETDLNGRLRLERIKKVSKEEKRYMYLWNIFIRKQRVFADGHVAWACEAFTKLHKEEMKTSKSFRMWWMLFSIKLYNCGLICGKTINNCSNILLSSDETGPSTYNAAANANNIQSMEVDEEE